MAFHFLPDHPIHGVVNGHAKNVRLAKANADSVQTSIYDAHPPSHSVADHSQAPNSNLSGIGNGQSLPGA